MQEHRHAHAHCQTGHRGHQRLIRSRQGGEKFSRVHILALQRAGSHGSKVAKVISSGEIWPIGFDQHHANRHIRLGTHQRVGQRPIHCVAQCILFICAIQRNR
jgi:hypothetical protein